jgi:protein-S-isoprenylcysteine O-methyltransferase Ste14
MTTAQRPDEKSNAANGVVAALRVYGQWIVVTIMVAVVMFVSAGRVDLPMFWVYLAAHSGSQLGMTLLIFRRDHDLLEERQNPGENAEKWDRPLLRVYALLTLSLFVTAGMDVGRFHWSEPVALWGQVAAMVGFVLSFAFNIWAMAVNSFYSRVVRIQGDRGQIVVTDGPYRFVRHPSYIGSILSWTCAALALGSWLALVPVALIAATLTVRTALEDRTLQDGLDGYKDYARRVRYRLLPGIW